MATLKGAFPRDPFANRPDKTGISDSFTIEEVGKLAKFVGAPRYDMPKDEERITAETLAGLYNGKRLKQPSKMIHMAKIEFNGWHTILAPPEVTEMNQEYEIEIWDQPVLERAAEDIAPPTFQHKSQIVASSMDRAHLGALIRQDFFKLPDGKKLMEKTLKVIVQATWIFMKIQVVNAIFNATQFWRNYNREKGIEFQSAVIATDTERRMFGILSRDHRGLSELVMTVRSITSADTQVDMSMCVLAAGTLDMMATNPYWSEAYRLSTAIALDTYSRGGRALQGLIERMTVYEDSIWNVSNIQNKDEQQLVHTHTIGMFFGNNAKEIKIITPGDSFDNAFGLSMPCATTNSWQQESLLDMMRNSGVWGSDGKLSPIHDYVLNNLGALKEMTGLEIHNGLLDPYFWRTDAYSLDGNSPVGEGFKKIEEYGSAEEAYFPTKRNIDIARSWKQNYLSTQMRDDDLAAIDDYQRLSDGLVNFDPIDSSIQAYAAALLFNEENYDPNVYSDYTKANQFGSSQPPRVIERETGKGKVKKLLYNINASGEEMYVYIAVTTGKIYAELPLPKGTIVALFDAPLLEDALDESNQDTLPEKLKDYIPSTLKMEGLVIKLADAPKKLYGYAVPPALETAMHLQQSNDSRGWDDVDSDTLTRAERDVPAVNSFAKIIKKAIPRNHYWDRRYIQQWMKSGDADMDAMHVAAANLLPKARYPFLVRAPSKTDNGNSYIITVGTQNDGNDTTHPADVPPKGLCVDILNDMGFVIVDDETNEVEDDKYGVSRVDYDKLIDALAKILIANYQDPSVREDLFNESNRKKIFEYYKNGTNNLGVKYASILHENHPGISVGSSFSYLFHEEVAPYAIKGGENMDENTEKAAKVFYGILSLARNKNANTELQLGYIESLRDSDWSLGSDTYGARPAYEKERRAKEAIKRYGGSMALSPRYVNVRLVMDNEHAKRIAEMAKNRSADDPQLLRANMSIIRPAHPRYPNRPLGPQVIPNNAKDSVQSWEYSKTLKRSRRDVDTSILGYFAHYGVEGEEEEEDEDNQEGLTPYTAKSARISENMYGEPSDIMYSHIRYEDDFGNEVHSSSLPSFVEKTNLIRRLKVIAEQCPQDNVTRMIAQCIAMAHVHFANAEAMTFSSMQLPFGCMVAIMPWIKLKMSCAIFAQPGSETAVIGHNYEDIILQLNGADRKWRLNYSNWIGCFIKNNKKILVWPAVAHKGYVSGMDCKPYVNPGVDFNYIHPTFTKSVFYVDCGGNFELRKDIVEPLSLTMKPEPGFVDYKLANNGESMTKQQLPCGFKLLAMWGFHEMNKKRILKTGTVTEQVESTHINTVCWSGSQRTYSHVTREHTNEFIGKSHIAKILPPELLPVLNGQSALKGVAITEQKV